MKKLFTTLALLGAVACGVNAQKTINLRMMGIAPSADFTISCGTSDSTAMEFMIFNDGPDKFEIGDTIYVQGPWNEEGYVSLITATTAEEETEAGDTLGWFGWNIHSSEVGTLFDASTGDAVAPDYVGGAQYLWAYLTGGFSQTGTPAITDPNDTNNVALVTVTWCESGSTGINDAKISKSIEVYPNPTNSQINFSYTFDKAATASVSVVDMTGRTVLVKDFGMQAAGTQNFTLDVANLPNGNYSLEVRADNNKAISKFTILK